MEKKDIIRVIDGLIQSNVDVEHACRQVLDDIDDEIIRKRLMKFQDDHRRHIEELSTEIRDRGGRPPELSRDLKGVVIEAVAAVRGYSGGTKSALKALKTSEATAYRSYSAEVSKDFPASLKDMLRSHFSDEKIHLDYIGSNLKALS